MLRDYSTQIKLSGLTLILLLSAFPSTLGHASLPLATDVLKASKSAPLALGDVPPNALGPIFAEPKEHSAPVDRPQDSGDVDSKGPDQQQVVSILSAATSVNQAPAEDTTAQKISQLTFIDDPDERKAAFVQILAPAIETANASIMVDRERLKAIKQRLRRGGSIEPADVAWLDNLAYDYHAAPGDIDELLRRVDVVPEALAISQAAVESGWGTSNLAQNKNAFFGQTSSAGFVSFNTLADGIDAYITNLNTHKAYEGFRKARALARSGGDELDGYKLAAYLTSYSELGSKYVSKLRSVMKTMDLQLVSEVSEN